MVSTSNLWINGSSCVSSTQNTYDVLNPASQIIVGRASAASFEDSLAAIIAADNALSSWESIPAHSKCGIFLKAVELIGSSKYIMRIVETVRQETAAVELVAYVDAQRAKGELHDAITIANEVNGLSIRSESMPGGTVLVERRPLGAVFAISPFNAPVSLAVRAVAVPLACGNTVVLKSSEMSPRSAEIVVELFHEAGLPKGALNLLHISKEESPKIVAEIISHKLIRHINFTGSDRVGKIIASEAAKYLKPCVLELGGKAVVVVLDDANVEEAARSIIFGSMAHSGQVCMSSELVIVQRGVSSSLIDALIALARKLHAGVASSDRLGPLISPASASNVLSLVRDAQSRGAKVIVGDLRQDGATVQPHVVLGVEPGWPLWERESFGPVFGIKIVDTPEEAVDLANKTDYSLMGAVWTANLEMGLKVARGIRAGHVVINGPTIHSEPNLGVHGLGGATGYGRFDIENFTQRRGIVIAPPALQLPLVNEL